MKSEIEDPSVQGIEDGRLSSLYFKKLNIADLSCAVFAVMGMVLSILAVIYNICEYIFFYYVV